jgi:histidyl-tRNA synthetase
MEEHLRGKAIAAATALRKVGISVDVVLENKKPKWVFQRADKLGADVVVMFAPDEAANNQVYMCICTVCIHV